VTVPKAFISILWLQRVSGPSMQIHRTLTMMYSSHSGNLLTFHRADFQTVLLRKLPTSYHVYCSKRLRSYEQRHGGPITLLFEDGTNTSCDVLVGADGIKSAVRRSLLGEKASRAQSRNNWSEAADITALIEPAWSGTNAYRALIPADRLRSRQSNHRALTQPMKVKYFS
jgi:salicylate hydroxylase